jgi:rhomboid protease GluP
VDEDPQEFAARIHELTPRAWVTPAIVAINAVVFAVMLIAGVHIWSPAIPDLIDWGANFGPQTTGGEPWRLFTSTYLHIGILHIAMNMFVLWQAGLLVERLVGSFGYAVMYTLSGLVGAVASVAYQPTAVSAGASGSVFGVFGCLVAIYLMRRNSDAISVKAIERAGGGAAVFIGYNLVIGANIEGIDMAAHVGGLVGGFVCGLVLSLPLTAEGAARRTKRAMMLALGGVVVVAASAFALPNVTDLSDDIKVFAEAESVIIDDYNVTIERLQRDELDDFQLADIIDRDVLPPWKLAVDDLRAVDTSGANAEQRRIFESLVEYAVLRLDGWTLLVEGLREQNVETVDRAGALLEQAEAKTKEFSSP